VRTTLRLRIPGWCDRPAIRVDGRAVPAPVPGRFAPVSREWRGGEIVELSLPSDPVLERRYNNSVAVVRGPLVFALQVPERWRRINEDLPARELPHGDWELHPAGPWSFALALDREAPLGGFTVESGEPGQAPFSPDQAPVRLRARGRAVRGWTIAHAAAAPPPGSPVGAESLAGQETELVLLPYGCTNLRVTELPWYEREETPEGP
jgi:hypothetical protein